VRARVGAYVCECFCASSLTYPARKVHAPYYVVMCGLSGSTTFSDIVAQTARFSGGGGKLLNIKCVFSFST
jgi:hypothetical protein